MNYEDKLPFSHTRLIRPFRRFYCYRQVVRLSYRQLSGEEERLEGQVILQWETFLSQMQDASEFINTQTPIMMKSLEQDHEVRG